MPTREELNISDAFMFSLFDTAYVVLHGDGTSEIVMHDAEDEVQDEGDDGEGDWNM